VRRHRAGGTDDAQRARRWRSSWDTTKLLRASPLRADHRGATVKRVGQWRAGEQSARASGVAGTWDEGPRGRHTVATSGERVRRIPRGRVTTQGAGREADAPAGSCCCLAQGIRASSDTRPGACCAASVGEFVDGSTRARRRIEDGLVTVFWVGRAVKEDSPLLAPAREWSTASQGGSPSSQARPRDHGGRTTAARARVRRPLGSAGNIELLTSRRTNP